MKVIEKLKLMNQDTREIDDEIGRLYVKIGMLEDDIEWLNDKLKESILNDSHLSKIEQLAFYLMLKKYPTDALYDSFSWDNGEYDSFGDIQIKICYNYGYTDIVGLSKEEFKELCAIIGREEV